MHFAYIWHAVYFPSSVPNDKPTEVSFELSVI